MESHRTCSVFGYLTETEPTPEQLRRQVLVVALIALAWFSIGVWRGLTVDEYTTWDNTRKPLADLIQNRLKAGHLPTFFVLEHTWVRVAGASEIALRMPSVVLVAASAVLIYLFLISAFSPIMATLGTFLYCSNQVTIWCAQNARPYAGILFAVAGLAWGLQQWHAKQRMRYLLLIAAFVVLGMSFYAAFGLTVIGIITALVFSGPINRRERLLAVLAVTVPTVLMILPALVLAEKQEKFTEIGTKLGGIDLRRPVNLLARVVFGDYRLWGPGVLRWPFLLLFAILCYGARGYLFSVRSNSKKTWCDTRALFAWAVMPILGLTVAEVVTASNVLSHPRYYVHLLLPIAILEAAGVLFYANVFSKKHGANRALVWATASVATLNLLSALAWFNTDGDGPKVVASKLLRITTSPSVVAGTTLPLDYEWRGKTHPELLSLYNVRTLPEIRKKIEDVAKERELWLFIYNNNRTVLDDYLTSEKGKTVSITNKLRYKDARAFRLQTLQSSSDHVSR